MNRLSKQQGLSLIELMISIALATSLMAGVLQFVISGRKAYDYNEDTSRIQENGRIALDILVKDLQKAGHPKLRDEYIIEKIPFHFLKDCTSSGGADAPCFVDGHTDAAGTISDGSDRISVQFIPSPTDTSATDCLGVAVDSDMIVVNVYTIDDIDDDGINSLYCQGYDAAAEVWLKAEPQPLVDGIDNMQVILGIASDINEAGVSQYISGDKLTVAGDEEATTENWQSLRASRIALLVSNGLSEGFGDKKARKYQLLDSTEFTINDGQPRRIYSTTVQFNNALD